MERFIIFHVYQWIGLRENLQENMALNMGFSTEISPKPIHWV